MIEMNQEPLIEQRDLTIKKIFYLKFHLSNFFASKTARDFISKLRLSSF